MTTSFIKDSPDAGKYLAIWKRVVENAKKNPDKIAPKLFWNSPELTWEQTRQEFIGALNMRIIARSDDPVYGVRGKKDCSDYFWNAKRDQRAIQDKINNRVRINWLRFNTTEAQKRFHHLLSNEQEDW